MIYAPDRYFREVISPQEFTNKNLAIYGTLIFAAITILLVAPLPYSGLHSVVYAFGFFIGLVLSLFLRSYFIDMSLRKMEIQIPYRQIASVVLFSSIINIYLILTGLLYGYDLHMFARVCNYTLILIGVHSLTKMNIYPLFGIGLLLYLLEFALVALLSSLL